MLQKTIFAAISAALCISCGKPEGQDKALPSWNDTPLKVRITEYVGNISKSIPPEDRIAVLDMDGTIICEQPLWCEMAVAAKRMAEKAEKDPSLKNMPEYAYATRLAENPADTSVTNNWYTENANYLDSILLKAFEGWPYEDYIQYSHDYLASTQTRHDMMMSEMFYRPMLELIDYLRDNEFQIFIVSGSMQGIVWSICPEATGLDRNHLIGTRQNTSITFGEDGEPEYIIGKGILQPKNNYYGKSVNIYNHIGKIPVMAVGNSVGDFGMFRMVSGNPYPTFVMMLNHDDAEREYAYAPYYSDYEVPHWKDSLKANGWHRADMSKEFKTVWMETRHHFQSVDIDEFLEIVKDPSVRTIDVRTEKEHQAGMIPGTSANCDVLKEDFSENIRKAAPAGSTLAIYCRSGKRSKKAAHILVSNGYKVIELDKGYNSYKNK